MSWNSPSGNQTGEMWASPRRVGEGSVKNLGLFQRLLHPGADGVVIILGLDNGEEEVRFVGEKIVGFLGFATLDGSATDDHAPLGEINLLTDLGHHIPFITIWPDERGGDELRADVRFREGFLVHAATAKE